MPLFLCAAGLLPAASAWSRDICWIDSVTKTQSGIEIRLSDSASAVVRSAGEPLRRLDVRVTMPSASNVEPNAPPIVTSITAKLGDEILLMGGMHNSCQLFVGTTNDRIGVLANADNSAPGLPRTSASKFIYAK
ncbi:MAG: hypothetical protein AAB403_02735 [Planctomycetota bacterium]